MTSYAAVQHVDTVLDDAFSCCCGWCSRGPIAARSGNIVCVGRLHPIVRISVAGIKGDALRDFLSSGHLVLLGLRAFRLQPASMATLWLTQIFR